MIIFKSLPFEIFDIAICKCDISERIIATGLILYLMRRLSGEKKIIRVFQLLPFDYLDIAIL